MATALAPAGTPAALLPGRGGRVMRAGIVAYIGVLVALPLGALVVRGFSGGALAPIEALRDSTVIDAVLLTIWTSAVMTVINAVAGTATAWVLVRYRFPGRGLVSALVDLPFAIPTLVTGIMLALLFGPTRPAGAWLLGHDVRVLYAPPAIVLALLFISVPFVVRAVEPVLAELDLAEEEAAHTLGAGAWTTFRRVVLPALRPAITVGSLQCFARALAEFGSIVVVSGNIPHRTLTATVLIHGEVEAGRPEVASAISVVLLAAALLLSLAARRIRTGRLVARRASPGAAS